MWCLHHEQLHEEEASQERGGRQGLERDLEEASRRLAMAHQDIRRLTAELDAARKNQQDHDGDGSLGLGGRRSHTIQMSSMM